VWTVTVIVSGAGVGGAVTEGGGVIAVNTSARGSAALIPNPLAGALAIAGKTGEVSVVPLVAVDDGNAANGGW
jgi:hypothetical protein